MTANWNEKIAAMGPLKRGLAIFAAVTLAVFILGFWVGFGVSAIERGHLPRKPIAYAIIVAGGAATFGTAFLLRSLFRGGLFNGMTDFDQRYWRMMAGIGLIGGLVGVGLIALGVIGSPLLPPGIFGGNIGPVAAVAITSALAILIGVAFWLYHRAIDDHEERAYLWGSQVAYYFVSLAIPAWWLLSRGGVLPPLDIVAAISIVIVSFIVQAAVWAWFKFR